MKKNKQIIVKGIEIVTFQSKKIRRHWDEKKERWYFSVIDIIQVLIDQSNFQLARNYWKVLKNRLNKEGSEVVTNCNRLKMIADDGKLRLTDVADAETLLRLIQSVPSPKAESIKLWLANGGRIAKNARLELEQKTGKRVVSSENFKLPERKIKKLG